MRLERSTKFTFSKYMYKINTTNISDLPLFLTACSEFRVKNAINVENKIKYRY